MRAAAVAATLCLFGAGLSGAGVARAAAEALPVYQRVAGAETIHAVAPRETLGHIAGRYGMKTGLVASINKLSDPHRLRIGQRLWVSNRRIVPATRRDGIVINVGDRMLYWLRGGEVVAAFPVGVGRTSWETPPGIYKIVSRKRDPVWHVPPSIRKEMRERGEEVKKVVPPGPDNPLGEYWLQLSVPGYGIHGTNAPRSVGRYTTHGCIRLRPEDIERLYREVPTGTSVDIVDEPVKLARLQSDAILLDVNQGSGPPVSQATFTERLRASGVEELVDMAAVQRVFQDKWGIAIDVSKKKAP
jgi:L,D-transpeptidase ErfK/SrfK